jgi:hypothetical protein
LAVLRGRYCSKYEATGRPLGQGDLTRRRRPPSALRLRRVGAAGDEGAAISIVFTGSLALE